MTHEDYGQETNHSLQAHMMTQFQDFFDRKLKKRIGISKSQLQLVSLRLR